MYLRFSYRQDSLNHIVHRLATETASLQPLVVLHRHIHCFMFGVHVHASSLCMLKYSFVKMRTTNYQYGNVHTLTFLCKIMYDFQCQVFFCYDPSLSLSLSLRTAKTANSILK